MTSSQLEQLNGKMARISSSNKLEDILTLAYVWAIPVIMQRQFISKKKWKKLDG